MALRIARRWNRDPDWFYELDKKTQIELLAEYRIENESHEQLKKRHDRIKHEKLKKIIEAQRKQ